MHDYPAFRYIHQNRSGDAYEDAMRLTFEYYIELEWLDGEMVLGCWDNEALVGGMLLRRPEAADTFDPSHPVTLEFISKIGDEAWDRLDGFELMLEENTPAPEQGSFEIVLLGVNPDLQSNGYGRFMLDYAAAIAREHPTTNLISLSTESPEKVSFYEHFGYEKVTTVRFGPVESTSFILRVNPR